MKMKKFKCSCGDTWFADDFDGECRDYEENGKHTISEIKKFTSADYAELWSLDLENGNRHDMTDIPYDVRKIILKRTKSETLTKNIMKEFYEKELGV